MRMRESFVLIYRDSISRDVTSNIQKRRGKGVGRGVCVRGEDCAFWTVSFTYSSPVVRVWSEETRVCGGVRVLKLREKA